MCLSTVRPVDAQATSNRHQHEGFWISFGLGAAGLSCSGCDPDVDWWPGAGGGGYIAIGTTPRQNLLLAAEFLAGGHAETPVAENGVKPQATLYALSLLARFYPIARQGFFVSAGPAAGVSSITGGGNLVESPAVGFTAGVGYDFRFGGRFAITPGLKVVHLFTKESVGETAQARVPENTQLFWLGTSLSWY